MERAMAAIMQGSRHLNLVAFDRGGSDGEFFSYHVDKKGDVPVEQDAVGCYKEAAAHEYPVGSEGAIAVAKHVAMSPHLLQLSLHGNTIQEGEVQAPSSVSHSGVAALCKALEVNTSITSFSVTSLDLALDSVRALHTAITQHTMLETLQLSANNMGIHHCMPLSDICKLDVLKHLEISRNDISGTGVEILCMGLCENNSLETIKLETIGLNPEGSKALSILLEKHKKLKELSIRCNTAGDTGIESLAIGLKGNKVLQTLNLSMNYVGNKSCLMLCKALKEHPSMTCLNLRNNKIQDEGAIGLAAVLSATRNISGHPPVSSLTSLDLDLNFVGEAGIQALCTAAVKNPILRYLELCGNSETPDSSFPGWVEAQEALASRR